jgi:hypothetical protein
LDAAAKKLLKTAADAAKARIEEAAKAPQNEAQLDTAVPDDGSASDLPASDTNGSV